MALVHRRRRIRHPRQRRGSRCLQPQPRSHHDRIRASKPHQHGLADLRAQVTDRVSGKSTADLVAAATAVGTSCDASQDHGELVLLLTPAAWERTPAVPAYPARAEAAARPGVGLIPETCAARSARLSESGTSISCPRSNSRAWACRSGVVRMVRVSRCAGQRAAATSTEPATGRAAAPASPPRPALPAGPDPGTARPPSRSRPTREPVRGAAGCRGGGRSLRYRKRRPVARPGNPSGGPPM